MTSLVEKLVRHVAYVQGGDPDKCWSTVYDLVCTDTLEEAEDNLIDIYEDIMPKGGAQDPQMWYWNSYVRAFRPGPYLSQIFATLAWALGRPHRF